MVLAHTVVTGDAPPRKLALFLHGILGSGANWRSLARRFVRDRPDWGAVLVDLRVHGESLDVSEPPDDLAACADDLDALGEAVEAEHGVPVRGVLGHSFGGKVALLWASRHMDALEELWLIDSTPSPRPEAAGSETTLRVLDRLKSVATDVFASRNAFIEAMTGDGITRPIAGWLAMNLVRDGDGFRFGPSLSRIQALLDDYFVQDLWSVLEAPTGPRVHVVLGGKSAVFGADDIARVERLATGERVSLDVIDDAGHWVHVDAPDALREILARR